MSTIPATLQDLAVPIDQLVPYGSNPRRGNVEVIAESLRVNGQYRPVVARTGTNEVLAGNHTLAAARHLGWDQIAATFVDCDDEQAKRIVLVDNRANDLAEYDNEALAQLLAELPSLDGTGFDQDAVDELVAMLEAAKGDPEQLTDPDDVPDEPEKPVSQEGDVWLLGTHRLAVGDGTDPDVVAKACGGRLANAYITDPPYNVAYEGKTSDALTIENDSMSDDQFEEFLAGLFTAALAHTRKGGPAYVFHADSAGLAFRSAFVKSGWALKQVLVWIKDQFVLGRQDHQWQHEPILYGWKPGAAHSWFGGRALTTLLDDQPANFADMRKDELVALLRAIFAETTAIRAARPRRNGEHPTMKPVALLNLLLDRSTRTGDLVLDTCAGSGSILIACHHQRRVAALVELDPKYADVICRRYQEHTGTTPILEATGEPHDFTGGD